MTFSPLFNVYELFLSDLGQAEYQGGGVSRLDHLNEMTAIYYEVFLRQLPGFSCSYLSSVK